MISASVPMAEASFIRAEQPLAPDLAADRAVLRTGGASRHHDIVFVVNPRESLTAGPCHAIDITREAIREGADAIIAVGGDRTLHEECQGWSLCIKIQNVRISLLRYQSFASFFWSS